MMTRFLLALAFAGSLGAAVIEGDIRDITGTAPLNTSVSFVPLSFPIAHGPAVVAGPARTVPVRDGKFTNTFAPGEYRVRIGSFTFDIGVPDSTNTYTLPELATAGLTTYLWTNPLPYTVAAGSNVIILTNATTYTISATASGTGGTNYYLQNYWLLTNGVLVANPNPTTNEVALLPGSLATNTPTAGQMLYATDANTARWDDQPTGGSSLWSSVSGAIYPSGSTGTETGWTSEGGNIYPQ